MQLFKSISNLVMQKSSYVCVFLQVYTVITVMHLSVIV